MAVYAVVGGVDFATDEPFPAGCVAGIKGGVPILIPGQQISIFFETFWEVIQAKPLINIGVGHIGLGNKLRGGMKIFLFLPVNGNLGFTDCKLILFAHRFTFLLIFLFGEWEDDSEEKGNCQTHDVGFLIGLVREKIC